MDITWDIDDGYAGGARPHTTRVPDEELIEADDVASALKIVEDYVCEDFKQSVYPCFDSDEIMVAIKKLRKAE